MIEIKADSIQELYEISEIIKAGVSARSFVKAEIDDENNIIMPEGKILDKVLDINYILNDFRSSKLLIDDNDTIVGVDYLNIDNTLYERVMIPEYENLREEVFDDQDTSR